MTADKIEYYLNKTHHKNLYFAGKIPPGWEFPSYRIDLKSAANTTIQPMHVQYTINNMGYNSTFDYDESLLQTKNILCLGDSNVFGLILEKDKTFVSKLQRMFPQHRVMNMGLPGGSADSVSRIAVNTVNALPGTVDAVLVIWPTYLRREFASIKYQGLVYKTPENNQTIPYPEYWDFIDWKSNSYNFYKNKLLVSAVCRASNIPFYDLEIDYEDKYVKEDMVNSYGKEEYTTFGFDTHRAIANHFYKKITGQPTLFEERCRSS